MKFLIAIAVASFSIACSAQAPPKVEVFSSTQIHSQLQQFAAQAKTKGSGGSTIGDYGSHKFMLSERTANGGAEIHAHFDDVMFVLDGKATLVTGGEVIDPHSHSDGETSGSGIRNGVTQSVGPGDVIHIPAGIPHQLLIAPGVTYSAFVIKIKE
jgi:mannose-6-phosphate isomerase-like protein (cupin superfamily)